MSSPAAASSSLPVPKRPPKIPSSATPSKMAAPATTTTPASDPNVLLDSLDTFTSSRATIARAVHGDVTSPFSSALDPVDFLNRHYTTESMLVGQLPSLRQAVSERMESLDDRISNALQRQSETAVSTRRHVQDARSSVQSLEKRIRLVREKASQSERAVLEITKDMKKLDCAKRNLQRTITTLKRLHMLVHAVEQLRLTALLQPFPDYKAASNLVDATRLLLHHFEAYTQKVQPMRLLEIKVTQLQTHLRSGLVRGFRIVGLGLNRALELEGDAQLPQAAGEAQAPVLMTPEVMADGLLLIDSLGPDSRQRFIDGICNDHLGPYKKLFAPKAPSKPNNTHSFKISASSTDTEEGEKPAYALEQVERRFAWYRRVLRELDEKFPGVFPVYWNFQYEVTCYFLLRTKDHLMSLLSGPAKDKDSKNATILLKALQKTILFEKEMMAWLQREYGTVFLVQAADGTKAASASTLVRGEDGEVLEFDESGQAVPANSAQGIRIKYERQKKGQQARNNRGGVPASVLDDGRASAQQSPVEPLIGVASSAFDNHMAPYIELEEQSMDEQLVEATTNTTVDTRGDLPVFTTSTKLFVYIKGSITRCTAMTKGKAFFLLYQAFQDALTKYVQVLIGKLPAPITASTTTTVVGGINIASVSSFGKQQQQQSGSSGQESTTASSYKISSGGEVTVCHVISTCEYCADTIEALEDLIRDTIDAEYKARVDMVPQQDAFHDCTARCIRVLVSGLENRVEGAIKQMTNTNWGSLNEVGEESAYVRMIHNETEPFVAAVRGLIPSSYFRSFCDKFALSFTTTYYNTLVRLKRITEAGAQQLLLDVYNIKTCFLRLPVVEASSSTVDSVGGSVSVVGKSAPASSIAPAMYTKMVTKQFKKIETLLKLVAAPTNLLIDVFKVQWVGGSALDLQTVMLLKGMKRNDQAAMLEKFGVDPVTAMRGAAAGVTGELIVQEKVQMIRERGTDVAAKVNSDLNQMRQKVDDFRRAFR